VISRWLSLRAAQAILRAGARLLGWLALALIAVAAAPVSAVAAGAVTVAWRRAWPPHRLLIAAAWCGPMVAVWLAWIAGTAPGWVSVAAAPYHAWLGFWHLAAAGALARAAVTVAPPAIPLGLAAGALAWAYRTGSMKAGVAGLSPASRVTFDQRQWRHQERSARARIARPGSIPLTMRGDLIVVGSVIRTVGHRSGRLAAIEYSRLRSHQVVVGMPGTGKTTLLLRLWTAFMAAGLSRHAAGLSAAPLLVVLDCKGGSDARRVADEFWRVLREAGVRSVAVWPDKAGLSMWQLPPRQLTTTLVDLVEHGTGSAAYYADVMDALIGLAVEAPGGPPRSASDLLGRLEPGWLAAAYAGSESAADHAMLRSASRHLGDVALRLRTLFRRLGTGLDGPGSFEDADAWYCILEGTDQIPVAEAQARALADLLADFAVRGRKPREILLAVDEFSAVSRRLPIWQLYERARSLGLSVQVSAQSWQGLGSDEDQRRRIAASAEGGIWLLRTPHPEPLAALAGTREELETIRTLARFPFWRRKGSSRLHAAPVVDPGIIRRLDVGQTAYIYRGGVTFIQVKRLMPAPEVAAKRWLRPAVRRRAVGRPAIRPPLEAASAAGAADGAIETAAWQPGAVPTPEGRGGLPDVSPVLDAAFGPEPQP
jgi:hypothetical protein